MVRVSLVAVGLLGLTACPPGPGECTPGAQRCAPDRPGVIQGCDCDSRGGELNSGCRVAPHWVDFAEPQCRTGDTCFEQGDAAVCVPEILGDCTYPGADEYCIDGNTVHRCEPWDGLLQPNPDGTFDGVIAEYDCDPGWTCQEDATGAAYCGLPPE
jgi:hypothetical protein